MNTLEVARVLSGIPVAVLLPLTISIFSYNHALSTIVAFAYGAYASAPLFPGWQFWLAIVVVPAFHLSLRVITGVRHRHVNLQVRQIVIGPTLKLIAFSVLMAIVILFGTLIAVGIDGVYSTARFIFDSKTAHVLTGGFVAVFIGGTAVDLIVRPLTKGMAASNVSVPRILQVGAHIGRTERLLYYILVAGGTPEAAVLVLTAKSLVRLPNISSDMNQAEYYLIGTLSSITVSLVSAIGTRLALGLTPL
jgi:uncharacterized membrane protein YiaA